MIPRLLSPLLAVVPWWLTMIGTGLLVRWFSPESYRTSWTWLIGGTTVLLLSALAWGALTAWSSLGTLVAGTITVVFGVLTATWAARRFLFAHLGGGTWGATALNVVEPRHLVPIGTMLVAAGLGAAGARHLARR